MSSIHFNLNYEPYPKLTDLKPGIKPLEFNVLVLPRKVAEKQGSVFIPRGSMEREDEAGDEGLLVAVSTEAFASLGDMATVGHQVMFARYAGKTFIGADGKIYRLMKDKDILGEREPEPVAKPAKSGKVAA